MDAKNTDSGRFELMFIKQIPLLGNPEISAGITRPFMVNYALLTFKIASAEAILTDGRTKKPVNVGSF